MNSDPADSMADGGFVHFVLHLNMCSGQEMGAEHGDMGHTCGGGDLKQPILPSQTAQAAAFSFC